jgi:hypothetical protein
MASDYALEGPKWGTDAVDGTYGGTVTWSLQGSFGIQFRTEIQQAFGQWAGAGNIDFTQAGDNTNADIELVWGAIDGPGSVLGYANYTYSAGLFTSAEITFDSGEHWTSQGGSLMEWDTYFEALALHEIGHAIGIAHYDATTAIMNPYLPTDTDLLLPSDIHAVQALYGSTTPEAQTVQRPDGTQVTYYSDTQDQFAWSTVEFTRDNSGHTTSVEYQMDDASRVIYLYDPNNVQSFGRAAFVYNADGKVTSVDYNMDNGDHLIYTFDPDQGSHVYVYDTNDSQPYAEAVFVRDASGRTTTIDYELDDATHLIYNYDGSGNVQVSHYDASWQIIA